MDKKIDKKLMEKLEKIAKDTMHIQTLEVRNMDYLDFHDCSVTSIKKALLAAYVLGKEEVNTKIQSKIETFDPDEFNIEVLQSNMRKIYGLVTLNK